MTYIANQTPLGKATVEKLESIGDNNKKSGGCGKSHQAKDGRDFGDVQKGCHSEYIQGEFAVGLYILVKLLRVTQERCGGMRMRSV